MSKADSSAGEVKGEENGGGTYGASEWKGVGKVSRKVHSGGCRDKSSIWWKDGGIGDMAEWENGGYLS